MARRQLRKPSQEILDNLARNIRSFRREKGLSQEEFAASCGLHRTYVGSIERGERNVTLSSLEVLSSTLDVSVVDLLQPAITYKRSRKPKR